MNAVVYPHPALGVADVCRFVRDTDYDAHKATILERRFPAPAVAFAFHLGFLARQVWLGEETDYVDLTPDGEEMLVREALRASRARAAHG